MKNKIKSILIFLIGINCIAQTPTIPLFNGTKGDIPGAYYKDVYDFYNQYEGTWLYTNGNTSLKFIFEKKEVIPYSDYYIDALIGEYRYVVNNIEKVNTLNNLNQINTSSNLSIYNYNLYSITRVGNWHYPANDCPDDEFRVKMSFNDPLVDDFGLSGALVMRKKTENGIEKLYVNFYMTFYALGKKSDGEPSTVQEFRVPFGEYVMIKQ